MLEKEKILDEIKRTTEENGGKALGEARFQKETGIGPYEWGRFWTKFGDMLEEAGIPRNKPWTRIPDEVLVERMISKIRTLERYPTIMELRIEGDQDPTFPYHIIKKRKQRFIVEKIVGFCNNKPEYADILKACEPIIARFNKADDTNISVSETIGEVYLFKTGRYYKIGKTNDTVRRGQELRIQLPEKLDLIHSIKTDDPSGIEAYWHKRFEAQRLNGEWFDLRPSDIKVFKRWRKIY